MPRLVFASGADPEQSIDLTGPVLIGRSPDCDLPINRPGLSRRHCRIDPCPGGWEITDLESTNGTLVNGEAIFRKDLNDGDEIQLGSVKLQFCCDEPVGNFASTGSADSFSMGLDTNEADDSFAGGNRTSTLVERPAVSAPQSMPAKPVETKRTATMAPITDRDWEAAAAVRTPRSKSVSNADGNRKKVKLIAGVVLLAVAALLIISQMDFQSSGPSPEVLSKGPQVQAPGD